MIFFKTIIFVLALPCIAFTQKLDIDGKKVKANFLRLPEKTLPATVKTYTAKIDGIAYVSPWGLDPDAVKEEFLQLDGFQKVEADGDLAMEIKMTPIRFLDFRINNSKTDTKDSKTGKVTTTYKYWYEITYEKGFSGKLLDKTNKVLWDYSRGLGGLMRSTTDTYKSTEYSNYKDASDAYSNNRVNLNRDIAGREIRSNFGAIRSAVNKEYGYSPIVETFTVYVTDTEKHAENANFIKTYEDCKYAVEGIEATELTEATTTSLAPVIDYYKSVAEKYKADEKADSKLRYACYYNLANIALILDRPDEAILWANKLIENDYDKKDGKGIIKDAEALKELFKKYSITSRRFKHGS
jgi:hypothetical protein